MIATSVHAQLLGPSFDRLPPLLRDVHDDRVLKQYAGRCSITRGQHWIARVISRIASLPRAQSDVSVTVVIERGEASETSETFETWTRHFGAHELRTVIRASRHGLEERFGPVTLTFELSADADRIEWRLKRARLLFMPLPASWFQGSGATEDIVDGRYRFDARARIAGIGLLVHYKGWLTEHGRP